MSCKNYEELIDGFLDNELEEYEALLLQHHFQECRKCKERFKRTINLAALIKSEIGGMHVPQPSEDFSRKVVAAIGQADSSFTEEIKARQNPLAKLLASLGKPLVAASLAAAAALIIVVSLFFVPSGRQERFLTVYELAKEKGLVVVRADDGIDHLINEHLYRSRQSSLVIDRAIIERAAASK